MKVIIVSGVPGTGKTTLAKKLSKEKNLKYIDVNALIKKNKLANGFDRRLHSKIVDVKKLNKLLIGIIKKSKKDLIIDSHLAHYLPKRYVTLCIVTKTSISKLRNRLKKRRYSKVKIEENVDAQNFDICFIEAKELGHKIKVIIT
ncbi:MAG: adenylate kinase family protein [Nanoarchaeota archaeon]